MRSCRVLLVGLDQTEIQRCEQTLCGITPNQTLLPVGSLAEVMSQDWSSGFDYALVACRNDLAEVGAPWSNGQIWPELPPVIALVDSFEPDRVVSWLNSGAFRVIPFERLEVLLPPCVAALDLHAQAQLSSSSANDKRSALPDSFDMLKTQMRDAQGAQNFLESILNTFNTIILLVLDREGTIIFFNHYAELVTGYTFAEVYGRNVGDIFLLPEEKREVQSVFQRLLEEGKPVRHQNFLLTKDGISRRIDWSNSVLFDAEGKVDYLIEVGKDISEEFLKAAALRQSEERFTRIFQSSPIGLGILNYSDGRFIDANDSLVRMLECKKELLTTITPVEAGLFAQPELRELLEGVVQHGPVLNLERRLNPPSRRNTRVLVTLEMIAWSEKPAVLMIVEDVSERWQAEEKIRKLNSDLERRVLERTAALQAVNRELAAEISFRKAVEESSQRLIQIIWETPDVVGICNLEGHLLYANKAARTMFSMSETEPVGHISVFDVYPEDRRPYIQNVVSPLVEREGSWSGETEFILPSGRRIPVSQVLLAHRDSQGKVMFFSTIARDISEQKQGSIEIEKAYRREKELGILRTNFFSMTSHQFRTPLSAILSSAELLEHYGRQWSDEKRGNHFRRIHDEIRRMTEMLDNILILSRIESTSFDSNFGALDLCEMIRQSVQEAEIVDRNQHTYALNCISGSLVIKTSPEIINRIIDNLFTNAAKYAPAGTSIEISLNVVGKEAVIEVRDHGVGIPEDEMEMIFQPFYRASNVADTPGTGLGLLIVEKSLQLLGGGIQVFSQVGEGTRVVMHIPLLQE